MLFYNYIVSLISPYRKITQADCNNAKCDGTKIRAKSKIDGKNTCLLVSSVLNKLDLPRQ